MNKQALSGKQQEELISSLKQELGLPEPVAQEVANVFQLRKLKPGDYWQQPELAKDAEPRFGWVVSGHLRIFGLVELGDEMKEVTQWISAKGYFVVDAAFFFSNGEPRWHIVALDNAEVLELSQSHYHRFKQQHADWTQYEVQFLTRCFSTIENRVFSLLSLPAAARFQQLDQYMPELKNTVPYKYLASMLGMTPETFSRIRALVQEADRQKE